MTVVISQDIEFDEEDAWNWEEQQENTCSFIPYFDEEGKEKDVPMQESEPPTPQDEGSTERP